MTERSVILIVDDTPENLQVLGDILEQEGYEVLVATSGAMALHIALAPPPPDLILLDIMMPEMDGYEVCRRLKANAETRAIPVVFLTAMANSDDEAKGLALGAVDYIAKPFKVELVKVRITNHLALRHAQVALQRYNSQLEEMVRERTRELAQAHARLLSLDSAKNDFLHSIAHELRTPANGVLGIGQLAIDAITDRDTRQKWADRFAACSARLIQMMNDSQQLAEMTIAVGDSQQTMESIDLQDIFLALTESLRPEAVQKGVAFHVANTPPAAALGSGKPLQQAVKSIIQALMLIASPGTTLGVDFSAGDDTVVMAITAQGKPLTAEEIQVIFQPFSKTRSSSTLESLGFALPLSAKIIMSMGGRIDIRNTPDGVQALIAMIKARA